MIEFLKVLGHAIFRVFFSVEYHGVENVPLEGSVIIAGNHPSYLDPVLVGIPVSRLMRFMAWDALFKVPVLGRLIRSLGAFPVDIRRGKGESAYREAVKVLQADHALVIFPEGQRSEQGPMGELRTGVARLAMETGAPIVPVTIGGASRAWPKWKLLPKPAKIIVRYHRPIQLSDQERAKGTDDKEFLHQVMNRVAERINRSLTPALRQAETFEKWYRQPPSHIRSYEWAPLIAALVATIVAFVRDTFSTHWIEIWFPILAYYLYLVADLSLIKPSRSSKWLRNSMPVWLIIFWHYPLTSAVAVPEGSLNLVLTVAVLAAFFTFFWEDYYTLQKFVRGLVSAYYFSLAVQLALPYELGTMVAILIFVAAFSLHYRTLYYPATVGVMIAAVVIALLISGPFRWSLPVYFVLGILTIIYLQTFASVAYDIRRAGVVTSLQASQQD